MAHVAAFPAPEQDYMDEVREELNESGIETTVVDEESSEILADIAEAEGAPFDIVGLQFNSQDDARRAVDEHGLKVADDSLDLI